MTLQYLHSAEQLTAEEFTTQFDRDHNVISSTRSMAAQMKYLWSVIVNCFLLFIVIVVFERIENKSVAIVVAALGFVYVGVRTLMLGQLVFAAKAFVQVHEQLFHLRKLLNDPTLDSVYADFKKSGEMNEVSANRLIWLESVFLFVVFVVCLFVVFTSLP